MASQVASMEDVGLHSEFFTRVGSLPVVNSALESAYSFYDASKHRFRVLDNLETSIKRRVLPQLTPLVHHLHNYEASLTQLDSMACSGLTYVEDRLPIIREPTDRVFETSKRAFDEHIVAPVQSARHAVVDQVSRSIASASHVVDGHATVNGFVQSALGISEQAIDRFLPEPQTSNATPTPAAASSSADAGTATEANATGPTSATTSSLDRAQKLGSTLRRRLIQRRPLARADAAAASATVFATSSQLLLSTAENLQHQLQWLRESVAALQASLATGNLGRAASHATASVQRYAGNIVHTLQSSVTSFSDRLPVSVRRDTEYLRRIVLQRLHVLQHGRAMPSGSWFEQLVQTSNAAIEYLGAVQTQMLQYIALHTPAALLHLLPPLNTASAPRKRRADADLIELTNRAADTGVATVDPTVAADATGASSGSAGPSSAAAADRAHTDDVGKDDDQDEYETGAEDDDDDNDETTAASVVNATDAADAAGVQHPSLD